MVPAKIKLSLHHHAHLGTQGADGILGNIMAVNENLSGIHIVEAADQVHDGGLSGSRGAYDGIGLSLFYLKVNAVQNLAALFIAERHILELHISVDGRKLLRAWRVFYPDRLVDGLKDTLQVGDGRKQGVVKRRQGIDGGPESSDISRKGDQNTDCQP